MHARTRLIEKLSCVYRASAQLRVAVSLQSESQSIIPNSERFLHRGLHYLHSNSRFTLSKAIQKSEIRRRETREERRRRGIALKDEMKMLSDKIISETNM